eukprot:XP_011668311.1 PREDICTED: probable ATP-dependent RNA helicase DDX59 [Strongylocentrotus purpuratus]
MSYRDQEDVQHDVKESENPESDEEPRPIVSFSKNQRWPDENEPVCVVCGKYGEYICSQTEADVCSLECKAKNLVRRGIQTTAPKTKKPADDTIDALSGPGAAADDAAADAAVTVEEADQLFIYREHPDIAQLAPEQVQDIRNEAIVYNNMMSCVCRDKEDVQKDIQEAENPESDEEPRPIVSFSKNQRWPDESEPVCVVCGKYGEYICSQTEADVCSLECKAKNLVRRGIQTTAPKTKKPAGDTIDALSGQDTAEDAEDAADVAATVEEADKLFIYREHPDISQLAPEQVQDIRNEVQIFVEGINIQRPILEFEQLRLPAKRMLSMKTALLVGGLPLPPQLHRLRQGIQFIVGTPGRIMEIIKQEGVCLSEIKLVAIDEVDTMLQLGFQQQVYDIMTHLPDNHQTIFTSATIPSSIEKMASSLLSNPVFISVGTPSTPCTSVKQTILWVEEPSKKKKLFAVLQDPKHFRPPAIVFVDSKLGADLLAQAVEKSCGVAVASLHGDKPQIQRNGILQRFRDGAYDVLVSTAVLGRGIDLPGVKMVINFDMPGTVEEYIHQIGRTGRLGTNGTAMTFINNNSKKLFLQFTGTLKPLGVILPPELINSPHLSYHRQQHRSRDRRVDASSHRGMPGGSGYHDNKRSRDRESVTDILKKRKRKFKP